MNNPIKRVTMIDGKLVEVELTLTIPMSSLVESGTLTNPKRLGLWDTKDETWIGTQEAPFIYDNPTVAQVKAQLGRDRIYSHP